MTYADTDTDLALDPCAQLKAAALAALQASAKLSAAGITVGEIKGWPVEEPTIPFLGVSCLDGDGDNAASGGFVFDWSLDLHLFFVARDEDRSALERAFTVWRMAALRALRSYPGFIALAEIESIRLRTFWPEPHDTDLFQATHIVSLSCTGPRTFIDRDTSESEDELEGADYTLTDPDSGATADATIAPETGAE